MILGVALALLAGCVEHDVGSRPRPNIMVVLVDDIGISGTTLYGVNPEAPDTPTLKALAEQGILFRNGYASPVCSATRAGLITGRWNVQTGVGNAHGMPPERGLGLPLEEVTLPEALDEGTGGRYEHAMVGKWHLHDVPLPDGASGPTDAGFAHYRGNPDNLGKRKLRDAHWENQGHYWKAEDGEVFLQEGTFITSDEIDDTLYFTQTLLEPWFIYLAPHAGNRWSRTTCSRRPWTRPRRRPTLVARGPGRALQADPLPGRARSPLRPLRGPAGAERPARGAPGRGRGGVLRASRRQDGRGRGGRRVAPARHLLGQRGTSTETRSGKAHSRQSPKTWMPMKGTAPR